jgi:hypothetical protein
MDTHERDEGGEGATLRDALDGVENCAHTPQARESGDGTYVLGPFPYKRQAVRRMILGMKSIAASGHLLQVTDASAQGLPIAVLVGYNGLHALVKMDDVAPFHQGFHGLSIADLQVVFPGCPCTHGADHATVLAQGV